MIWIFDNANEINYSFRNKINKCVRARVCVSIRDPEHPMLFHLFQDFAAQNSHPFLLKPLNENPSNTVFPDKRGQRQRKDLQWKGIKMQLKMQETGHVVKSESPGFESWLPFFFVHSVFLDKQFGFSKVHFPSLSCKTSVSATGGQYLSCRLNTDQWWLLLSLIPLLPN